MTAFTIRSFTQNDRTTVQIFEEGQDYHPVAEVSQEAFGWNVWVDRGEESDVNENRRYYEDAIGFAMAILQGLFIPVSNR